MVCVSHRVLISGNDPANVDASGVEVSGNATEFISGMWQKQFDVICPNQEVTTIAVKNGAVYPIKVQMFFEF